MKNCLLFTFTALTLLTSACSTRQAAVNGVENPAQSGYLTLADFLRRDPKVRLSGSGDDIVVYIRSTDTILGNYEPLFVIDESVYASSYQEAARLIVVEEIRSVQVLSAAEGSARYGFRGSNGAVRITTKGGSRQ